MSDPPKVRLIPGHRQFYPDRTGRERVECQCGWRGPWSGSAGVRREQHRAHKEEIHAKGMGT